ncbi:conjugal transfer protein MobB [Chryseobacterium sp. OV279]|uniref:conjugal transfer protein MobB n=1 Tax=Chryseobacterium sp. OV279 TaxID=1500285 RepID=UPI0009203579|nr:conjugal transfer protein MobB [Chryseobacterium sp. OV279]SHF80706.1 Relaxase/Mobilisation nuclease domain-containing protein [Chryseobacterium sp. OV279]
MIAKIGRGSNLYGALAYNNVKVEQENGKILLTNRIIETPDGKYTVSQLAESFNPYLAANRNTEKHTLHISLNPDPKDEVGDERFVKMAEDYMREMGYGEQPYVVFKHMDINRTHIHIVSVCVDEEGKKITDEFERKKSMNICRELEQKYGLHPAVGNKDQKGEMIFQPVDYKAGNVKSQIASVIRYLPKYYRFRTLGEYNALLSLFNISAETVEGELHGKMQRGLLYFPLNTDGKRLGHSFKASLFGKSSGLPALESYCMQCREALKNSESKVNIKTAIAGAMQSTHNEKDFKNKLTKQGINTVIRRNDTGLMYGITFIDHHSKTVWNGSGLGKEFSSNSFSERWTKNIRPEKEIPIDQKLRVLDDVEHFSLEKQHYIFDNGQISDQSEEVLINALGGLLSFTNGEDRYEQDFAYRMKKRKKKRTR